MIHAVPLYSDDARLGSQTADSPDGCGGRSAVVLVGKQIDDVKEQRQDDFEAHMKALQSTTQTCRQSRLEG